MIDQHMKHNFENAIIVEGIDFDEINFGVDKPIDGKLVKVN